MIQNASEIAKVILKMSSPEYGDTISNLKLQKLLYYMQGFHLAMFDEPLFKENVVAWEYGPVVIEVYNEYKRYDSQAIPQPDDDFEHTLTDEQIELVGKVYRVYGQFSAFKLMRLTHEESPWMNTKRNSIISHKRMRSYFLTQLESEENEQES
jgi:uncharacterized phage-associated protein